MKAEMRRLGISFFDLKYECAGQLRFSECCSCACLRVFTSSWYMCAFTFLLFWWLWNGIYHHYNLISSEISDFRVFNFELETRIYVCKKSFFFKTQNFINFLLWCLSSDLISIMYPPLLFSLLIQTLLNLSQKL